MTNASKMVAIRTHYRQIELAEKRAALMVSLFEAPTEEMEAAEEEEEEPVRAGGARGARDGGGAARGGAGPAHAHARRRQQDASICKMREVK
jgi:hypothetical protein